MSMLSKWFGGDKPKISAALALLLLFEAALFSIAIWTLHSKGHITLADEITLCGIVFAIKGFNFRNIIKGLETELHQAVVAIDGLLSAILVPILGGWLIHPWCVVTHEVIIPLLLAFCYLVSRLGLTINILLAPEERW